MHTFAYLLMAAVDLLVITYLGAFFLLNIWFVGVSYIRIQRELQTQQLRPVIRKEESRFLPLISLLVPAYNEEVTIADSLRSLLALRYLSYEIIVCNDGSKDRTLEALCRDFDFMPIDMDYNDQVGTSLVRGFYESRLDLPERVRRLILIDKENGGKADALNAALNVAEGEYIISMDADSLLVPDALLHAIRPIMEGQGDVVAVGAQVGLSNGSRVEHGKVIEVALSKLWIARFQSVEYMRSFAQGRTAMAAMNSLLILSGVFALMRRDMVLAVGGFLTKHMRARIGLEYCAAGAHTVCEDMEIIVRIHRYLLDKGLTGKVVCLPFPVAWTEAPENYRDLGKQRARWYRGLLEVLYYHRAVLFRMRFRQIGMFSLPYQIFFEVLAPVLECLGYIVLVAQVGLHILSMQALVVFAACATGVNLCLSTMAILLCVFSERATQAHSSGLALVPYARLRDIVTLFVAGFLSTFGYRQYLLYWQLRGLIDFLRGKQGWDKFARKGFTPTSAT